MFTTLLIASVFFLTPAAQAPASSSIAFTQYIPVQGVISYTVKPGDTLESIASDMYGDSLYWKTLWNDNDWITDPNALTFGSRLTIREIKPEKSDDTVFALQTQKSTLPKKNPSPTQPKQAEVPVPTVEQTQQSAPVTAFEDVYKQAGDKYGVPWQVLYGLHITETGGRDGMIMNGTGSGARGPMQFMPGTWRAYGVDGDGDGVANIDNAVDAIHGAANFLAKHGSLESGLRSYGGNTSKTLALAREKGYGN